MSDNFYLDTPDLAFHLSQADLEEVVRSREDDFDAEGGPGSYEEATALYDAVLGLVGEVCAKRIAPRAEGVDREGAHFEDGTVSYAQGTRESLDDLKNAQLMGVMLPRRFGGLNMPYTVYNMMMEMVSRADASLHNLVGLQEIAETIHRFGTEEQRQHYLPRLASGEADGAMALTESGAGSDLQAVATRAWQDAEGRWYLNGVKQFITNGCADILLVLARSEEGSKDGRGLSMFVCERGPKLTVRRIEEKLGIHGSPTCELQFDDVPAELVGARRRGLTRYVMSLMNGARVAVSAQAVGIADGALRSAVEYAGVRRQFGRPIGEFPAVIEMLATARVQVAGARALLYETTEWVDKADVLGRDAAPPEDRSRAKYASKMASVLTPLSKAYSTEVANEVAYDSLQVHGGSGYMRDYNVERNCRDARVTNIYEGTTQLQHVAAIGGVLQRVLASRMDELAALPFQGVLADLAGLVARARGQIDEAVAFVTQRKDPGYQDLMTRRLCHMETLAFTAHLLLAGAHRDPTREAIAERFVLDAAARVEADARWVCSGDRGLLDRRDELLAF